MEDLRLDIEEIDEFLFTELTNMGYAIEQKELIDVADVVYSFMIYWLVNQGVVSEIFEIKGEEEDADS